MGKIERRTCTVKGCKCLTRDESKLCNFHREMYIKVPAHITTCLNCSSVIGLKPAYPSMGQPASYETVDYCFNCSSNS